jgi:hypothetical protein
LEIACPCRSPCVGNTASLQAPPPIGGRGCPARSPIKSERRHASRRRDPVRRRKFQRGHFTSAWMVERRKRFNRVRSDIGCPNPIQWYASILSLKNRHEPSRRSSVGSFWFSCREPTGGAQLAGAPGFFGVILAGESRPNAAGVSKSEDYSFILININRWIGPPLRRSRLRAPSLLSCC